MDCMQAMAERYSFRGAYQDTPVSRADLRSIMEAGLTAPSGCNQQTTSLIGVDDPALVRELGAMLNKKHFASAPAAICVLTEEVISYGGVSFHVQDYAAAIQNMLVAVTALGYASCWVEGYVTNATQIGKQMARRLGVPEHMQLVAYLPVGVPAEPGKRAEKKSFAQRAWFNGYQA